MLLEECNKYKVMTSEAALCEAFAKGYIVNLFPQPPLIYPVCVPPLPTSADESAPSSRDSPKTRVPLTLIELVKSSTSCSD